MKRLVLAVVAALTLLLGAERCSRRPRLRPRQLFEGTE